MIEVSAKHLRAAMLCQAKNDVRHYLNGILFARNGDLVATDGHKMFVGSHNGRECDVVINIKGNIPQRANKVVIDIYSKTKTALIVDGIGAPIGILLVDIVDGRYPDYKKQVERFSGGARDSIHILASIMEVVCKVAKIFSTDKSFTQMEISCTADEVNSPYRIEFTDHEKTGANNPFMIFMAYRK